MAEVHTPGEQPEPAKPISGATKFWLGVGVFAMAFLCLIAGIILPIVNQADRSVQTKLCISNLRKAAAAFMLYASDNNDHLPDSKNWVRALHDFEPDDLIYACPVQRRMDPQSFGYAFAKDLSKAKLHTITQPDIKPLVFDSSDVGENASGGLELLPNPGRHRNGRENNVCYADGHAAPVDVK